MSGNKSLMRFDFPQRIKIATLRPVIFCWCLMFRSLMSSTFHRPSASVRSSPFLLSQSQLAAPFGTRGQVRLGSLSGQLEGTHQSGFSFPEACENEGLRLFQRCDGILTSNSGVLFQEFIQRFSTLQIVKQGLEGNACTTENWLSAVNFGILYDDALRDCIHSTLLRPS